MTPILASLANASAAQAEQFDRLLRRAAAYCWLERFKREISKGEHAVGYNQIGEAAGNVWKALEERGPLTMAALMEEVNAPQSLFFMAIGWLSREEKVRFEPADGDYLIRLA
jgi:Winged helix-turn-helix domain (DUF2582)